MTPEMQAELLKRLDLLATKLGVTVDHLWAILVRQANLSGMQEIVWAGVALLAAAGAVYVAILFRGSGRKYVPKNDYDDGKEGRSVGAGAFIVVTVGLTALAIAGAINGVIILLNPEYWAFREVLRLVR